MVILNLFLSIQILLDSYYMLEVLIHCFETFYFHSNI